MDRRWEHTLASRYVDEVARWSPPRRRSRPAPDQVLGQVTLDEVQVDEVGKPRRRRRATLAG